MTKITGLRDLEIYLESLKLVKDVFDLCKISNLAREYSLCDQIKRASVSANIAEGYGRRTKADFAQFLSIALGSCNEVVAFIDVISLIFPAIEAKDLQSKYEVLGRRIFTFRKSLTTNN